MNSFIIVDMIQSLSGFNFYFQEINLSNFYATFRLLLRDSKTLEVQTSTSKRCLFRTEDMIGNHRLVLPVTWSV